MTNSARAQSKAYNAMHSQIFFLYESAANVLSENLPLYSLSPIGVPLSFKWNKTNKFKGVTFMCIVKQSK